MTSSTTPSTTLQVPSIDISRGLENAEVITQLADACEQWGFFQLTGHGIDATLRSDFFAAITDFFALPSDVKNSLSRNQANFWGYFDKELTKNKQDSKEIFDIDGNLENLRNSQTAFPVPWPPGQPELQEIVSRWLAEVEHLSRGLLEALCVALGEPPTTLNASFVNPLLWNEYKSGRGAGDYADLGEEIQIAWYRLS